MKYNIFVTIILGVTAFSVVAQDLSKEITVDHDIVPEKRAATPLNLRPMVNLSPFKAASLSLMENGVSVNPVASAVTLAPAAYGDTLATSTYPGYVAVGFFPAWNASLSAGYRFIDNDRTRLNAWLQYDGNAYGATYGHDAADCWIRHNDVTLGGVYHQAIASKSNLEIIADYTRSRYNLPGADGRLQYNDVNRLHLTGVFSTRTANDIHWFAGASYSLFNNSKNPFLGIENEKIKGVTENNIRLHGGVDTPTSSKSKIGLDAALDILSYNRSAAMIPSDFGYPSQTLYARASAPSSELLTVSPYYRLNEEHVKLDIGARVDLAFNGGKFFHIAPEVKASWSPVQQFCIYGQAGGGEHRNTLSSLLAVSRFMLPYMAYSNSHIPLTVNAGLRIGPFAGASIEIFGGYAIANDWLMPCSTTESAGVFREFDIKGWRAGAAVSYVNARWGSARLSYECAPHSETRSWYIWRDRASRVVTANLTVTPISKLSLDLEYQFRSGRRLFNEVVAPLIEEYPDMGYAGGYVKEPLGIVSTLNLGATYSLTRKFSVFVRGENLLNRRYRHIGLVESQGVTALLGITYKF